MRFACAAFRSQRSSVKSAPNCAAMKRIFEGSCAPCLRTNLKSRARASDLLARYGGEEFVVILDGASRDEAIAIAEQVRAAFAKQSVDTGAGQRLTSTVSAGCSTLEQWEVEGTVLLERADVALAMAKAGGRDQVVAA